jgi:hypothetical protein
MTTIDRTYVPQELITDILIASGYALAQSACQGFRSAMMSPDAMAAALMINKPGRALGLAVCNGKLDVVRALLIGNGRGKMKLREDMAVDVAGSSDLQAALSAGNVPITSFLLDRGVTVQS